MDGSSIDFVVIPVIVIPLLVLWLVGMYHADSHAAWRTGPSGAPRAVTAGEAAATPAQVTVPAQAAAPAQAPARAVVPAQAAAPARGEVLAEDSRRPGV
jgi:hypothetical protein